MTKTCWKYYAFRTWQQLTVLEQWRIPEISGERIYIIFRVNRNRGIRGNEKDSSQQIPLLILKSLAVILSTQRKSLVAHALQIPGATFISSGGNVFWNITLSRIFNSMRQYKHLYFISANLIMWTNWLTVHIAYTAIHVMAVVLSIAKHCHWQSNTQSVLFKNLVDYTVVPSSVS